MNDDLTKPKKSLGQHWLNDPDALKAICEAADIKKTDTILEIGPGQGSLTQQLLNQAGEVIAVELDEKLIKDLDIRFRTTSLKVINQDILKFDLDELTPGYKIVANIPYYLTNHLIRVISESSNPPKVAVLLVQKEVAERVAAQPGSMSLISVVAQYYSRVKLGRVIHKDLFTPSPKVDSQILILSRKPPEELDDNLDLDNFFRLAKAGFSQRRKTLVNSLSAGLNLPKDEVANNLTMAGISPQIRAQNLSLEQWAKLYTQLITKNP